MEKAIFRFITLLLLLLTSQVVNSEINLTETDRPVELWRQLFLFEEAENSQLSWHQVFNNPDFFQPQEKPALNFGYRDTPIWLKVKLVNHTDTHRWGFSIDNAAIDYIDVFLIDDQGNLVDSALLGDMRPFSQRKLQTLSQSASFELRPDRPLTLLIKVYGQSTLFLPIQLATEQQLQLEQNINMLVIAFLVGIMFALGLNNLYIFYSIGDKAYGYYCFYLSSLIGFALYTSGMGYQYFWRDMTGVQNVVTFIFVSMLFHGALSFSQKFLQTAVRLPGMHRFINYFKYFAYSAIPISILVSKSVAVSILTMSNLVFVISVVYCGIQSARQKYTPAYFYLTSWFFLIFGLVTYNLTVKGVIEPNFYTTKALAIGSAIEAILLSSALAFRMRKLITERNSAHKQAQKALLESNDKMTSSLEAAERYNKAKDEFVSVVNHELRTPMNGIIGNLQLMEFEELNQNMKEYVESAQFCSKDMMHLIDNMLFITEYSSNSIILDPQLVEVNLVYDELLSEFLAQAEQKQIIFDYIISLQSREKLLIDWRKYKRLITCLIENAIKFTFKGSINVDVCFTQNGAQDYLTTRIRDTGIGMSKNQQAKLFVPFSQANTSYSRPVDGLGLGLTVAKKLADLFDAKINIESEVDIGTTVTVHLPVKLE